MWNKLMLSEDRRLPICNEMCVVFCLSLSDVTIILCIEDSSPLTMKTPHVVYCII